MESEGPVYLLHCRDSDLGDRLERVLAGLAVQRVDSMQALRAPSMSIRAAVVGIHACSDGEIASLRSALGPLSPPCVVVTRRLGDCLRRLGPLRSGRLSLVATGEVETRLVEVLENLEKTNQGPMSRLGLNLLSEHSFRPPVKETISRVCGLHDEAGDGSVMPEVSVRRLAHRIDLAPVTLRQYWRQEVPLRCNLKEFLSWAVLLWAVRARAQEGWNAIVERLGLRRRTLQRSCIRLAGCTLAQATEDPDRVVGRFNEWADSVWESGSGNGSGRYDRAPGQDPGAEAA